MDVVAVLARLYDSRWSMVEPELVKQTIAAGLIVRTIEPAAWAMASAVVASGRVSVK